MRLLVEAGDRVTHLTEGPLLQRVLARHDTCTNIIQHGNTWTNDMTRVPYTEIEIEPKPDDVIVEDPQKTE